VLNLGPDNNTNEPKKALGLTDVSDKLYQPVKRENKIRVVRIAASGLEVAGF
jgi:adhesin/invasin